MNRENFRFASPDEQMNCNPVPKSRLSEHTGVRQDEKLLTQKFAASKELAQDELRARTAHAQNQHLAPPLKIGGKAANFLESHRTEDLPTPKKCHALDTILIEIINDEEEFYELENFLSEEKNYDVDSLAFYVKVMEFKKEANGLNSTLAAGMIIDNYLAEDAQYYIGNEIKSDELINKLISEYELVVTEQQPVPKDLFDGVCD